MNACAPTYNLSIRTDHIHYGSQCTIQKLTSIEYPKQQFAIRDERDVNDVISMTDNEAMRTTFVRTRPALQEDEDGCYETKAENYGHEATLTSRT